MVLDLFGYFPFKEPLFGGEGEYYGQELRFLEQIHQEIILCAPVEENHTICKTAGASPMPPPSLWMMTPMPPPPLWLLSMIPIPASSFQLLKGECQELSDVIWDVLAVPWLLAQEDTL